MLNLNELGSYRENNRLEAKKAIDALPKNLWETYSAFANTSGGVILLGVEELPDKSLRVAGVSDPEKLLKDFWNTVNNPEKISVSILLERHVRVEDVDDEQIVVVEVPRADRGLKPVYLNHNPYTGTYRRNGDGDYRCPKEMVLAMIRDSGDKTQDMLVLDNMSLEAFDYESLLRYRNRMKITKPGHVWGELEDVEFLQKLGAIGVGEDEKLHPTAAGLLMFGFEYEILHEYPQYFLDYQEHFDADVRWTDRLTSASGEWSGNIYDFFFKVYNKLIQNPKIKIPFRLEGLSRIDDTQVHKALREALANCIFNADFYGSRGLVIRSNQSEIIMENPGSFRVTISEALSGGVSSPRNSVIMKMFGMLDIGERTGSGIPLIYQAWKEQGWDLPKYTELLEPDRSILTLSFAKTSDKKQAIKTSDKNVSQKPRTTKNEARKRNILDYLTEHVESTSREIAEYIGIGSDRARVYLQELVTEGRVKTKGENRNRTYLLKRT